MHASRDTTSVLCSGKVLDEAPKEQKSLVSLLLKRNWALLLTGDVSGAQRVAEAILKTKRLRKLSSRMPLSGW